MFPFVGLFVISELLLSVSGQGYNSRRCPTDRMRECKDTIIRSIQKRINDMNRQDMIQHCGVVREDFNCLLRETRCLTSEHERQSNGDILRKGLVYIRDGCDTFGGSWKDSSCYIGDAMKNCEDSNPLNSGQYASYDVETCRKYNLFQECVMHVLKNRCTVEDDKLVGQYLVAKAQDLSWNCEDTNSDRDRDRDRDRDWNRDRDNGRYGSSSDRYNSDRSRGRDQWRSQSDYGSDRYGSDRYGSDRYGSDRYGSDRYGSDRYDSDRYGSSGRYNGNSDVTCCRNERCDNSRMSQCRSSLTRTVDDRNGGFKDEAKCRKVRDDFNCLLWQTTCLPREERDRASDIFHRARDYISRYCDNYGRWSENSCYKSSEMQKCETYLSTSRAGANYESCRAYGNFRECMEDELRRRCTREDDLLQGAYLVEKAQEMSWQCGNENSASGTRNVYNTYNDRNDRYDRRYPNNYNNPSPYGSYEESQHLDDDDEMCRSRMQSSADSCKDEMTKKRHLITENDSDDKLKKHCCSAIEYRRCLFDASRRVCMQERTRVVEALLGRQRYEINTSCRHVYDRDCNGSDVIRLSSLLLVAVLALLLFHRW